MKATKSSTILERGVRLEPFLKWPGGKRWFANRHLELVPEFSGKYIEPFAGSASLFFALSPKKAILSDVNPELANVYREVKLRHQKVLSLLQEHAARHSDKYYYQVRSENPTGKTERAARFIYLNRSCFNGIYRVNLKGEFNVPKGSKEKIILETDDFAATSKRLRGAKILCRDFEKVIDLAQNDDLVFADPPYTVRHNNNGFIKYNENLFSWSDQERLAAALARAVKRGAKILATNANHSSLVELYSAYGFATQPLSRFSSISGKGGARKMYEELLIC